jgi:hypothetical protein
MRRMEEDHRRERLDDMRDRNQLANELHQLTARFDVIETANQQLNADLRQRSRERAWILCGQVIKQLIEEASSIASAERKPLPTTLEESIPHFDEEVRAQIKWSKAAEKAYQKFVEYRNNTAHRSIKHSYADAQACIEAFETGIADQASRKRFQNIVEALSLLSYFGM